MNNERLFEAVAEISDRHILEFMDIKPRKKHKALRIPVISAAACLLLIITAVPMIINFYSDGNPFVNNAPMTCEPKVRYVRINGNVYIYSASQDYELPEGCEIIGKVLSNNPNFHSEGLEPGDLIYQAPGFPNEIYVYTCLGDENNYRYIKFTISEDENIYRTISENDKEENS